MIQYQTLLTAQTLTPRYNCSYNPDPSYNPAFAVHAAGLRIKENKEVYEGEVTELTPEFTESEVSGCNGLGVRVIRVPTLKGNKEVHGGLMTELAPELVNSHNPR